MIKNSTNRQSPKILVMLVLLMGVTSSAFAQGDLLVYPKKLVFEGTQERVKILNFRNEGRDSATYKLSYIENRMTESGKLELVETPDEGQHFASPFLRFYPRSITLAPGETQTVKIQLTRTNDLEPGEYRSHLYIRAEEKPEALADNSGDTQKTEGLNIKLTPIYGISIPNIIRFGNPEAGAEISALDFKNENNTPVLSMQVNRSGKRSLYGTLTAVHKDLQGKETVVGKQGLVMYSPRNLLKTSIRLTAAEGVDLTTGTLQVICTDQEADDAVLATARLEL